MRQIQRSREGWTEEIWSDLRFTGRILNRNRRATLMIVATLALAMGANTAVFSLIHSVLLDPLPFPGSGRLVILHQANQSQAGGVSYPHYLDWREQSRSFAGIAVYSSSSATLTGAGSASRVDGAVVSAGLFRVLGVAPLRGRLFDSNEDRLGGGEGGIRPVIISQALWESRFDRSSDVLGKDLRLDGDSFRVIGVLPRGLEFPIQNERLDYWTTVAVDAEPSVYGGSIPKSRGYPRYDGALGRLKPGVSLEQAQAEMNVIAAGIAAAHPGMTSMNDVRVVPALSDTVGDTRPMLWLLFGLVTCVLLVGCANAANLLLLQATIRRKEFAIRGALGAKRSRLARQLLIESLLYAVAAGFAGLLLAWIILRGVVAIAPAETPRLENVHLAWAVLAYTLVLSALTGLLFGIYPAMSATRLDPQSMLKEGARSFTSGRGALRSRSMLTIAQITISLVLTCCAALLTTSFVRTLATPKGFDPNGVLTASLSLPAAQYQQQSPAVLHFYQALLDKVGAMPSVQTASVAQALPLSGQSNSTTFQIEGEKRREMTGADLRFVDPAYFATLRVPLVEGRGFGAHDVVGAEPCILVNRAFQKQFLGERDFRGTRLKLGWGGNGAKRIVGVVGDVKHYALAEQPVPEMYVPLAQFTPNDLSILIRTAGDPHALAPALRTAVQQLDPAVPVDRVRTLDEYLVLSVSRQRFLMLAVAAFSLCTLMLAAIGLYGVVSYSTASRRQEFGIRLALGASSSMLVRLVLRQGVGLAAAGVILGLGIALFFAQALSRWIYDVDPLDPIIYSSVAALLLGVAALACWGPARRASLVDPVTSLRSD